MALALMVDRDLNPKFTTLCPVRVFRIFPGLCYPCINSMSGSRMHIIDIRQPGQPLEQFNMLWRPDPAPEYNQGNPKIEGMLFRLTQPGNMLESVSSDLQDASTAAALRK